MKQLYLPYNLALRIRNAGYDAPSAYTAANPDTSIYTSCTNNGICDLCGKFAAEHLSITAKPAYCGRRRHISSPTYMEAILWLLNTYRSRSPREYDNVNLKLYSDTSGGWKRGDNTLESFNNLDQAVEKGLNLIT